MATRLPEAPDRPVPAARMRYEEFLEWADEDTRAEWIDGEVILLSPSSDRHQEIVELLLTVLKLLVQRDSLGWLRVAPFQMRLSNPPRGREPDLLFVREERRHLVRETYLDGAADLIVEVTSPESFGRDRGEKFLEYEMAGVEEYWLIDPDRKQLELYRLGPEGRYAFAQPEADGSFRSKVIPGFWIKPEWLWQEPIPNVLQVARWIGVLD